MEALIIKPTKNGPDLDWIMNRPSSQKKIQEFADTQGVSYGFADFLARRLYDGKSVDSTLADMSDMRGQFHGSRMLNGVSVLEENYLSFPNGTRTYFINEELKPLLGDEYWKPIEELNTGQVEQFLEKWDHTVKKTTDKRGKMIIVDPDYSGSKFVV